MENKSVFKQIYDYSATPYPAWIYSGTLLATPLVSKSTVVSGPQFSRFFGSSAVRTIKVGPSALPIAFFSGTIGLGGYMIYDDALVPGSLFSSVWSFAYILANRRGILTSLRYGKVWPSVLLAGAFGNFSIYGRRYLNAGFGI